ncbi:MAG: signal peptidase I [Pseudomonadota bacterium]
MFKLLSLPTVLIIAAISGAIVVGDLVLMRSGRQARGEAPPAWISSARTVFAWTLVIALLWWTILIEGLELALVVGALLTGVVYALEVGFLRKRRIEALGEEAPEPPAVEYARSFFPVILLVLVVRSFLFEPFRIPSASMVPTLLVGDFIFVNKFSYGIRLPVLRSEVLDFGEPERGEVVVFRLPSDNRTNYIKRVIGLPGDTVTYLNGVLLINGERVEMEPIERYTGPGAEESPEPQVLLRERLGERVHDVLQIERPNYRHGSGEWVVPAGHYFMMGDNRDNSQDSRYLNAVGFVPEENLVGRAEIVWLSVKLPSGFGLPGIRFGRFGDSIT